jgi:predicted AAA+ superfamily ATPase
MPELFVHQDINWRNFYADYVKTYIERDVRRLTQVADESSFMQFMSVCAAMTGQILNMASLARDVGISEPTAKRWLSILQTSGIVYLLRPYFTNAIKRITKAPKLYFLDTGLAAYLTRWLTPETLSAGAAAGHYFETFVIGELLKSYTNSDLEEGFYYMRDGSGREIDLLIFQDNTLYPIEIKKQTSPSSDDIRHFEILHSIPGISIGEGGIICPAANLLPLKNNHKIIPVWAV